MNVRLSREIEDPVASATANGTRWSSAQRDNFLNDAIRELWQKWIVTEKWDALRAYVNEEVKTLVANVTALSGLTGGCSDILGIKNNTSSVVVHFLPQRLKHYADLATNQYVQASATFQRWIIENSNLRILGSGATDAISIRYIKQYTAFAAGGANDIDIPNQYWHQISKTALAVAFDSDPDITKKSQSMLLRAEVNRELFNA